MSLRDLEAHTRAFGHQISIRNVRGRHKESIRARRSRKTEGTGWLDGFDASWLHSAQEFMWEGAMKFLFGTFANEGGDGLGEETERTSTSSRRRLAFVLGMTAACWTLVWVAIELTSASVGL
jgi:hypothetical protein